MALMMVDIDHFKNVNDRYGHPVGDKVLCSVVEVLRERVRSQDLVGRYGGEEFMVLLPDTTAKGGYLLAQQLCEAVQAVHLEHEGQPIPVTVSIGVYGGRLQPGDHWDMLISAADRALYEAKEPGATAWKWWRRCAAPHRWSPPTRGPKPSLRFSENWLGTGRWSPPQPNAPCRCAPTRRRNSACALAAWAGLCWNGVFAMPTDRSPP